MTASGSLDTTTTNSITSSCCSAHALSLIHSTMHILYTQTHTLTLSSPSCCYRLLCVPVGRCGYLCPFESTLCSLSPSLSCGNYHLLKIAFYQKQATCHRHHPQIKDNLFKHKFSLLYDLHLLWQTGERNIAALYKASQPFHVTVTYTDSFQEVHDIQDVF